MTLGKPLSESTIVASWLRAELESKRFAHLVTNAIERGEATEQIILTPDVTSPEENKIRMRLLRLARPRVIRQFPWRHVEWFELFIENRKELGQLYTPFGDTWLAFTNGERVLGKAADFIQTLPPQHDPLKHVIGIQEKIAHGIELEPPILVTSDRQLTRPLNILEGNVRCVSYYLHTDTTYPLRAYVGISPHIVRWAHSGDTLEDIRMAFRQGAY